MDVRHSKKLTEDINNGIHKRVGMDGNLYCTRCSWHIQGIAYNLLDRYYCEQCYLPMFNVIDVGGSLGIDEYNLLIEKIDGLTDLLIKLVKELGKH